MNDLNLSQIAVSDHARGMAHHCVAGVIMRQAKDQSAFFGEGLQFLCFRDRKAERFIADHIDS